MNDEEEDAKQRGPDRGGIGPGIELGPPSVVSLLRLGQGVGSPGFANYNFPRSVESGLGNCNMHFAVDADADPAFGPGFARIPCPSRPPRDCSRLSGGRYPAETENQRDGYEG